jgi:isopenicillin N synthase-like dioxygenase
MHQPTPLLGTERASNDLATCGFSKLEISDELEAMIGSTYEHGDEFFGLDSAVRSFNSLPFGCGYVPFGQEHSGDPARPDRVDFFAASARTVELAEQLPSHAARHLHRSLMAVFEHMELLAERLIGEIATQICKVSQTSWLRDGLRRWSQVQLSRAIPTVYGEMINTRHEDGHFITFAHANGPGLELAVGETWVPAQRSPQQLLVMAGSIATLMTGGRVPPAFHRVRASHYQRPRMSVLFFADLDPKTCIPWVSTELNAGVDVGARVRGNAARFGVTGFKPE